MSWMSDKQDEAIRRVHAAVTPAVPAGESLVGVVHANQPGAFSAKLYAIGITERHLIMQPVSRKWEPSGTPVVLRPDEIDVGNIFDSGTLIGHAGIKGQQIRFSARGEKYKLMVLGGNVVENMMAGSGQLDGLGHFVEFLARSRG
jgi:hypothetical protein